VDASDARAPIAWGVVVHAGRAAHGARALCYDHADGSRNLRRRGYAHLAA
jgi:hypothetical protein